MLQNAYLLAKIGADTAENERNVAKNWQLPHGSTTLRALGVLAALRRQGAGQPRLFPMPSTYTYS